MIEVAGAGVSLRVMSMQNKSSTASLRQGHFLEGHRRSRQISPALPSRKLKISLDKYPGESERQRLSP
jgi:hypothetical protein